MTETGAREAYARRIRDLRDLSGLSQERLAERMLQIRPRDEKWKVEAQRISGWENGENVPLEQPAQALARVLVEHAQSALLRGATCSLDDLDRRAMLDLRSWDTWWQQARNEPKTKRAAPAGEAPAHDGAEKPAVPSRAFAPSRRQIIVGAAAAALCVILALIAVETPWRTGGSAEDGRPTTGAAPPGAPGDNPIGNALILTVTNERDGKGSFGFVYPSGAAQTAGILRRTDRKNTGGDLFADAMADGAYGLDGLRVTAQLTTTSADYVTVYDVRPVTHREPAASGLVVYEGTQGNDVRTIGFSLDAHRPVAKMFDVQTGSLGGDFFSAQRIAVSRTSDGETLLMQFDARQAAYTFTIAVDYVVGGRKYTQYLDHGKSHRVFRASAALCHEPFDHQSYQQVRFMDLSQHQAVYRTTTSAALCRSWSAS
ncbi:helix-turn-helix transcriptional regulator [Streptomyces sp. NPDC006733]|uniref:helix-turn-helix domain-containing protein n=1 Tax=Streptomyces sp. NPDC006733 TaxID=3155460 RepID=UPI0033FFF3BA